MLINTFLNSISQQRTMIVLLRAQKKAELLDCFSTIQAPPSATENEKHEQFTPHRTWTFRRLFSSHFEFGGFVWWEQGPKSKLYYMSWPRCAALPPALVGNFVIGLCHRHMKCLFIYYILLSSTICSFSIIHMVYVRECCGTPLFDYRSEYHLPITGSIPCQPLW